MIGDLLPLARKLTIEMSLWPTPLEVFCCTLAGCDMNPVTKLIERGRTVPLQVRTLISQVMEPYPA